ncbi:BREX-1 system phosphatase PglZ type A [Patescibacteria group bacterium]
MKKEIIEKKLSALFNKQPPSGAKRHIVFWYDTEQDFKDLLSDINLPENVKVKTIDNNYFYLKYLLEHEDLESHFLLYCPKQKPPKHDNWLLDMNLYSAEFYADPNSIILNELGISDRSLELLSFISSHKKFFNSKKRLQDCSRLLQKIGGNPSIADVQKAMIVTLTQQKVLREEDVIRAVLLQGLDEKANSMWVDIQKHDLQEVYWGYIKSQFGYSAEQKNLSGLFTSLIITYIANSTNGKVIPDDWNQYILSIAENALVFVNSWMNHKHDHKYLEPLVKTVDEKLNLKKRLSKWPLEDLVDVDLIEVVDELIIKSLCDAFLTNTNDHEKLLQYLRIRNTKYWYEKYQNDYQSLQDAINLKHLINKTDFSTQKNTDQVIANYCTSFFKIDLYYRYFINNYHNGSIVNLTKELLNTINNLYNNNYLDKLTQNWKEYLDTKLREDWWIAGVTPQTSFYQEYVEPIIFRKKKEKVFVIISDALRFDVGTEISEKLNKTAYGKAELSYMQSTLPSITSLGMAALLPHQNIKLNDSGLVLVDNKRCSTLEERDNILKKQLLESAAFSLNGFTRKSREEKRQLTQGLRVIYLYHNHIDAIGDNAKSEDQTLKACDETIDTIIAAIKDLTNTLSASNIIITADHGFIYTDEKLLDKDLLPIDIVDPLIKNKRYLLTKNGQVQEGAVLFNMESIIGQKDLNIIIPNGYMRFKTQGGGRKYIHGGHSLQEIIVPVISYKHVRKHVADDTMPKKVDVELINKARQITTNVATFHFYQKQPVYGRYKSRKLKIGLWAKSEVQYEIISNEAIIIFNKDNKDSSERKHSVNLTLKRIDYKPSLKYYLRLLDIDSDNEYGNLYQEYDYQINILISHDF